MQHKFLSVKNKGEIAILLTILSLVLMVGGIGVGTLLTQKQTRTASRAATGATCANTPWDNNGDHHADGGCAGLVGQCIQRTINPDPVAQVWYQKWFLCKAETPADHQSWNVNGDTWYGACDDQVSCQAAQAAAGFPTTAPANQPTSPPAATQQPATAPQSCNVVKTSVGCSQNIADTCQQQPSASLLANKYYECRPVGPYYNWFGPCDYNLCTTSPTPTPEPSVTPPVCQIAPNGKPIYCTPTPVSSAATTKINSSVIFKFKIGTDVAKKIKISPPLLFTVDWSVNSAPPVKFEHSSISISEISSPENGTPPDENPSFFYQRATVTIPHELPINLDNLSTGISLHVYSTADHNTVAAIPVCGDILTKIDSTFDISADEAKKILQKYNSKPVTLEIDCTNESKVSIKVVQAQQYTKQDLQNAVKGYTDGTYSPLQMSRFLVDYQQGLGLQMKFCDPTTGGCTAKFN